MEVFRNLQIDTLAVAVKAATTTIPVVFEAGGEPIELGLVRSLNRPGGNVTGVSQTNVEIVAKRLELMHELLPAVRVFALLVNQANSALAEPHGRCRHRPSDTTKVKLYINLKTGVAVPLTLSGRADELFE